MTRLNFSLTSSGVVELFSSEEIVEGKQFAFIICAPIRMASSSALLCEAVC
jgi:hypothetical protein